MGQGRIHSKWQHNYTNNICMDPITNEYELEGQERLPDIVIKPQFRYVFVQALMPTLVYVIVMLAWALLPAVSRWLHYGLMVLAIVCCFGMCHAVISLYCTQWVITEEEICYRRGVIARREDYLELYRINDYVYKQSVLERFLGLTRFYIVSTDVTTGVLCIYGIPRMRELQAEIRHRVELQRRKKRIYEIGNH